MVFEMNNKLILAACIAAVSLTLTQPSFAKDAAPMASKTSYVAVVDNELLMSESLAAQSLNKEFKKSRDVIHAKIEKKETELRSAEQDLEVYRTTLSAEDYEEKRAAFVKQFQTAKSDLRDQMMVKENAFKKAAAKLQQEIINVVAELSEEQGYDIVFPRSAVIIMTEASDITETALKRLNKRVKSIDIVKKKK
jgi:Skp family chaperone for outer membrane proteins